MFVRKKERCRLVCPKPNNEVRAVARLPSCFDVHDLHSNLHRKNIRQGLPCILFTKRGTGKVNDSTHLEALSERVGLKIGPARLKSLRCKYCVIAANSNAIGSAKFPLPHQQIPLQMVQVWSYKYVVFQQWDKFLIFKNCPHSSTVVFHLSWDLSSHPSTC
ncbi:hypothetical protein TNCV_4998201 [Trichonephila clavipes]|nr:hypothetical protein TNCV_4998201 [Trichonephila clavipes]